ncbi:helix-turn-helix domain-containing protein [Rhodoferax sp.]|uniref:TetR/AcrR family transcriptional regulator n=1 Tax=Rhodoferax sp. TaxID=50421 RepID=UPI0028441780|nr:helix-turn-helix domain-containing protein [Rhodoferax sp.]MDR3369555.1 helix-turn-helix domain containing protein [Rhodoferax sp.]
MSSTDTPKTSFKQRMLQVREDAIIHAVNRLLAEKGFEAMTVDEVAAQVGIAKASLYKHFSSKEDLAAAAIVRGMRRAQNFIGGLPSEAPPLENLRAVVRWLLEVKLAGDMPILPSQSSSLRATLMVNSDYMDSLMAISDRLEKWIEAAQTRGELSQRLPTIAILFTLFACASDPVVEFLQMGGRFTDEQITDIVLATYFEGINAR